MEFENQIDIKKLIKTVNNISTLKANTFKSNKFIFNIEMVSILQLIYEENNLLIKRYYLKCSNNIEIVLNEKYEFYRFNIFKENICYSYDNFGRLSYTYSIKEKSETNNILITKSNDDIYYHPDKLIEDKELEKIRKRLIKDLLCYCIKKDGRVCFYIKVRKLINYRLK